MERYIDYLGNISGLNAAIVIAGFILFSAVMFLFDKKQVIFGIPAPAIKTFINFVIIDVVLLVVLKDKNGMFFTMKQIVLVNVLGILLIVIELLTKRLYSWGISKPLLKILLYVGILLWAFYAPISAFLG